MISWSRSGENQTTNHNLGLPPVLIVAENSILVCGTAFWANMATKEKYTCVVNVGGNMELKLND